MPTMLQMSNVSKSFGATHALKNVSFRVEAGEVHTLIGENGAGKSTLMKILSGAYTADSGSLKLDGEPFVPLNPLHSRKSGIAMIYQELNLAPDLTAEENILLGEEPSRFGWLNSKRRREIVSKALIELDHPNIPLDVPVNQLTIAQQQLIEIARALTAQPKVLIMDEPTSSLTLVDTENLFKVIARLKQRGVSIVYISHFLEECQRICDSYTVLRDGESVGTGDIKSVKLDDIIHLMVGREMKDIYPKVEHPIGEPVMELQNIAGMEKPGSVSLQLREGEILGIAGLVGAGRTETLRAVFGLDRIKSGTITVNGTASTDGSPTQRLAENIGLLSENRKEEGLLLNRSLADNTTLTHFKPISRFGFINNQKQLSVTSAWIEKLEVKSQGASQAIQELSGGNQQKIAIGRLLHHDAKILLLDEPTRGIDVGSKAQIYKLMGELAAKGKSIIFVSSYLPELLGVCDSIGVMCRGELSEVRPASKWTEHSIISAAVGQAEVSTMN
jgi:ribose transport system ATP-binding protein